MKNNPPPMWSMVRQCGKTTLNRQYLYHYLGFKPDDNHFLKPIPKAIKARRKGIVK